MIYLRFQIPTTIIMISATLASIFEMFSAQFHKLLELMDLPANSKTISRIRRLITRCDIVWLIFEYRLLGALTFYGYTDAK